MRACSELRSEKTAFMPNGDNSQRVDEIVYIRTKFTHSPTTRTTLARGEEARVVEFSPGGSG
ncbi:hypothetical protein BJD99_18960 [Rhodococcus sp. 1163]|nr:hypothetical protein BJD99_18960 [Rhodococcus sp. 1163]